MSRIVFYVRQQKVCLPFDALLTNRTTAESSVACRSINRAAEKHAQMFKMAYGNGENRAEVKVQLEGLAQDQPNRYSCTLPRDYNQGYIHLAAA